MTLESCGLIDANGFANWGACFKDVAFLGDPVIASIAVVGMLVFIAYKLGLPHEVSLTVGTGVVFMLAMVFPGPVMNSLVVLTVMAIVIYLVRGVIKPAKR